MDTDNRYSRQKDIVPMEGITSTPILIVGCGAIGRNVATQLASVGVQDLELYDFDKIEESNVASQGFPETHINLLKVESVQKSCLDINKSINIKVNNRRFRKSDIPRPVTFMCVDNMKSRSLIWNRILEHGTTELMIDGRMAGPNIRILNARPSDQEEVEKYNKTLFSDAQAHSGSCTAKSTIFCSNIASGLMVSEYVKYLQKTPIDNDFKLSLSTNDLFR